MNCDPDRQSDAGVFWTQPRNQTRQPRWGACSSGPTLATVDVNHRGWADPMNNHTHGTDLEALRRVFDRVTQIRPGRVDTKFDIPPGMLTGGLDVGQH